MLKTKKRYLWRGLRVSFRAKIRFGSLLRRGKRGRKGVSRHSSNKFNKFISISPGLIPQRGNNRQSSHCASVRSCFASDKPHDLSLTYSRAPCSKTSRDLRNDSSSLLECGIFIRVV